MAHLPLVDRYPGTAELPRVELVDAPTPIDDLADLLPPEGCPSIGSLWAKRDDLTSQRYGGNKVRKLEFLLGEAVARERRAVITFGAYGSNHALATAVHASALGIETHVVLSPQAPGPFAARTLRAHVGIGTRLHVVEGHDSRRTAVEVRRVLTERDGIEPAIIPMGGTNPLGTLGYVNAALELLGQAGATCPSVPAVPTVSFVQPNRVYVAGGTLGTAIGLAIGFAAAGARVKVVAVRVTPDQIASDASADKLASETIALLRTLDPNFPELAPSDLDFVLRSDWFEPGYGVVTPEAAEAVAIAAAQHLKLETTYTGKAFAAMLDDVGTGRIDSGDHILFWDTFSSAAMPPEGPDDTLPPVLQSYVAECDRLFGSLQDSRSSA